ncbi:endoplasmic reticulum junction formation protein lunapark-A isoform X2 [Bactrocera neohumeralis]|uniref:endoplasmic reticulum junction formation protein lunapark-A isoform X2 n=1 Tax=Bactrocera neohumeralis TaxID=98809 RepID=UPI00216586F7|nr:endoplasmic reticulum junction formation protein lunapark-A isoform X2 [Bactrocera neohumeralis]
MGAILAKFRKEKSTAEVLEGLEEKITQIEKYTLNTQEQKRRIVGNFLATSIGIYVIAFIVFYFVYFPPTWRERIVYSVPLLLFPFVIILLRRLFTWYFERKLNKNSNKLTALHTEKKKILEQVMDKETYKVAVKLLAKYGDKTNGQRPFLALTPRPPAVSNLSAASQRLTIGQSPNAPATTSSLQDLRLRPTLSTTSLSATPRQLSSLRGSPVASLAGTQSLLPRAPLPITPQRRPIGQELRKRTPFPIVNQQGKGVLERIVDVLIGDGPKDRFAMICKECFAHNGMALKEDFDYATFRCAFCNALNPARKARPIAPRLPEQHFSPLKRDSSSSSTPTDVDSENDEPVGATPTPLTATTPRIQLTEAINTPVKAAEASAFEDATVGSVRRQAEIGAGDGPDVTAGEVVADAAGVEKMEIEHGDDQENEALAAEVVANLQALQAAEANEMSRLQERFAQMYATTDTEQQEQQSVGAAEADENAEEAREPAEELDEFKKLK